MAKERKSMEELLEEALVPVAEQPYEIPENWLWVRIGAVTEVVGGGTPSTSNEEYYINGDIPWITPKDLSGYDSVYISKGSRNITEEALHNSSARLLPANSVLMSSRAPIGYTAIAANALCTNQGFKSFIPTHVCNPHFIYWYIKFSKSFIESYASGTTFKEISGGKANILPFPLTQLDEQKQIVEKLERMLSMLKEAKQLIEEARETFKLRRASILHKAFTGELTAKWRFENDVDFEKHWEKKALIDISEVITKGASPRWQGIEYVEDNSQTLFITSENVREGYLDLKIEKYVQSEFNNKQKRSMLMNGDILVNIVGASIGRAAIYNLNNTANINQAVSLIRLKRGYESTYICYYLNSPVAQNYYSENQVDVARANLSLKDVGNISIPIPPLVEQNEIVRILDAIFLEEDYAQELLNLKNQIDLLGKSILSKAFRGELGTNDPVGQPAMELLEAVIKEKLEKDEGIEIIKVTDSSRFKRPDVIKSIETYKGVVTMSRDPYEILCEHNSCVAPKALYEMTGLEIEEFYAALKVYVKAGKIIEIRKPEGEIILEAKSES